MKKITSLHPVLIYIYYQCLIIIYLPLLEERLLDPLLEDDEFLELDDLALEPELELDDLELDDLALDDGLDDEDDLVLDDLEGLDELGLECEDDLEGLLEGLVLEDDLDGLLVGRVLVDLSFLDGLFTFGLDDLAGLELPLFISRSLLGLSTLDLVVLDVFSNTLDLFGFFLTGVSTASVLFFLTSFVNVFPSGLADLVFTSLLGPFAVEVFAPETLPPWSKLTLVPLSPLLGPVYRGPLFLPLVDELVEPFLLDP